MKATSAKMQLPVAASSPRALISKNARQLLTHITVDIRHRRPIPIGTPAFTGHIITRHAVKETSCCMKEVAAIL